MTSVISCSFLFIMSLKKNKTEYIRVHDDLQFVVKLPPMSPLQVIVFWFAVLFSTWYKMLPDVIIPSWIQNAVLISDRRGAVTIVLIIHLKFILPQL